MAAPSHLDETSFRALLGEHGVLVPGALTPPARSATYAVFAQRADARLDVGALKRQAERFFDTKLGLTVDKAYGDDAIAEDAARVVVHGADPTAAGTRLCYGRLVTAADIGAAEEAERVQRTYGLAALAQRCGAIWLIVAETDEDRVALTIAAIFASVMLGPIITPHASEIFGVRTARMKLERKPSPYR